MWCVLLTHVAECAEKAMAPHSSTLAWKIPWMEEPGRLQSMGSRRVGHDWVTSLSLFTFWNCIGEGNGNPLQCSCLENPRDRGAWLAAVYGVAQSRTRLKWLSSSSSRMCIGRTDAEAETPVLWPPNAKNWLIRKDPDAWKDWRQEEKGTTEDEIIGWHHLLDGHDFEHLPGVGDEQWSLVCSTW